MSLINYENILRGVEQDIKNAKNSKATKLVETYEKVEETHVPLTKHQMEDDYYEKVAQRVKETNADLEDELDERELQAYLNLKKAHKILEQREQPNQLATALLRSSEKVYKKEGLEQKLKDIQLSQHLPWIHTITLHSFKDLSVKNHEDDLERELSLYVVICCSLFFFVALYL